MRTSHETELPLIFSASVGTFFRHADMHHIPCTIVLVVEFCALLEEGERELSEASRQFGRDGGTRPAINAMGSPIKKSLTNI